MKLTWPLWQVVVLWFALHLIGILSFALGWTLPLGLIGGCLVYLIWGAFAQMVAYRVIVNKAVVEEWKRKIKGSATESSRGWGYVIWLVLPVIIYWVFFYIALGER